MGHQKRRELVLGAFFLVVGLGFLYLTSELPRKAFIDAAFVPYILAISMSLLGAMQIRDAYKLSDEPQGQAPEVTDHRTVLKTLALIVAYAVLFTSVGFPIMTVAYLFMQFIVLTPTDKKVNYLNYGLIALITTAVVYLTFRHGFDMLLPTGPLSDLIE
ncbi:MAG: tripartite tricarboxylate transporter TctB family protein [Burkholderiaceae bacterium]